MTVVDYFLLFFVLQTICVATGSKIFDKFKIYCNKNFFYLKKENIIKQNKIFNKKKFNKKFKKNFNKKM